jgi:xanthine dehydrogenase molybdopterin-binding subunit B
LPAEICSGVLTDFKIDIQITRLGGGFGRKSYAHFLLEAALISQKVNAPVKLIEVQETHLHLMI